MRAVIFVVALCGFSTAGQGSIPDSLKFRIDSLKVFLGDANIERRYAAEFGIAWHLFDVENPMAAKYAGRAYATAAQIGDTITIIKAGRIYGQLLRRIDDQDSAALVLRSIIPFAEASRNDVELSKILNALGALYVLQGRYDQSVIAHLRALKIRRQLNDSALIGASLLNIGVSYYKMANFDQAERYYNDALKYKDDSGRSVLLLNIALLRVAQGQLSLVKPLAERGLALTQSSNFKDNYAQYNYALGWYYTKLNKLDSAAQFYTRALLASREASDLRRQIESHLGLATCYTKMGMYDSAFIALDDARNILANSNHEFERLEYYDIMSNAFEAKASHRRALEFRKKHENLKDSLFHQRVVSNMLMARLEFEEEQNEAIIAKQAEIISLREQMIDRRNILLVLSALLTIALCVLAIVLVRFNRLQRRISNQLDKKVFDRTKELSATESQMARRLDEQRVLQKLVSSRIRASVATIRGLCLIPVDDRYNHEAMYARFNAAASDLLQLSQVIEKNQGAFLENTGRLESEAGVNSR